MRSAGLARTLGSLAPAVTLESDDIGAERRAEGQRWRAAERARIGVPLLARTKLADEELALLGLAAHECAHAAVALACGDILESVSISHGALSGLAPCWMRDATTAGSIIAEIAVRAAGVRGYELATLDCLGAYLSGAGDREDIEELLARVGLAGEGEAAAKGAAAARHVADRIVEHVLTDPEVWKCVVDLSIRLTTELQIDGAEIEKALVISDHVRAYVARLVA